MIRRLAQFLFVLIILGVLAGLVVSWRLWSALPDVDGRLTVTGLRAPVEILRDAYGVPHIRAFNETDAYYGMGVAHAQDRLWQMEFQRRVGRGRLSEVLGAEALETDTFLRTLGLGRVAAEIWRRTSAHARPAVEAYVQGVNAVISRQSARQRPIEFALLRFEPEPWSPEDCIVWTRVMSLGLDTNYRDELLRSRIVARVGVEGAAALMPEYTTNGPVILPDGIPPPAARPGTVAPGNEPLSPGSVEQWARLVAALAPGALAPRVVSPWDRGGSNNWVVSGARSATGKPLLANDPHLWSSLPSTWYVAHLQGGRLDVIGATMPGVAAVPIGHNNRIAWGVTAVMADVQDLYLERVNARNEAEFQGAWEPMRTVNEVIKVKREPDVRLAVRHTRHGPLVSDVLPGGASNALALRWTALDADVGLLEGQQALVLAQNWDEFTLATSKLGTPMLNFVYADVDGNIGYYAPGALPVRARENGTLPVPGWTGEHEWTGFVPVEQLPRIYNPTRGFAATANNKAVPDPYITTISTNWEPGYRAARINSLIDAVERHSVDSFARMQADVRTPQVGVLLPWMRRATPVDDESRRALERLRAWDGALSAGSADAALFVAWTDALAEALFADELGPTLWTEWARWAQWRAKALDHIATRAGDRWCDDVRTPQTEGCEHVIGLALRDALTGAAELQGTGDMSRWKLAEQNDVTFPHTPFHTVGWLRPVFSRHIEAAGNPTTIAPVMSIPRGQVISTFRQIVDLADFDNSRWVLPPGQSGQLLSRHYADQLERWRNVEYDRMLFSRKAVDAAAVSRLVLEPAR